MRWRPAARAGVIGGYVIAVEWSRTLLAQQPGLTVVALVLGGAALLAMAPGWPPERLGLGAAMRSHVGHGHAFNRDV